MKLYGLIGFPLGHSFSEKFFSEKFGKEKINAEYRLFPIENISLFPGLIRNYPALSGLNVTIPYKEEIIPFLDELDETARSIGAVNVIRFIPDTEGNIKLKGYNSDIIGFEVSLKPLLTPCHKKALILGTGGAAKGVAFVLSKLGIEYKYVSRKELPGQFTYKDLTADIIKDFLLIVNCSPVGTYPHTDECPEIPYEGITENHLLYDLIYNPEKTLFLQKGEKQGASIKNGLDMLHGQALAAWDIWNR